MASPQPYTVATAEQLRGQKIRAQKETENIQPHKVKPALKNRHTHHLDQSPERLKAVRFTPSTKDGKHDQGTRTYRGAGPRIRVHASLPVQVNRSTPMKTSTTSSVYPDSTIDQDTLSGLSDMHESARQDITWKPGRKLEAINRENDKTPSIRLDMSCLPPMTKSTKHPTEAEDFKIYFTPLDIDRHSTSLSSPKEGFETSSAKEIPDNEQGVSKIVGPRPKNTEQTDSKLEITTTQLDQLVSALVKAPVITNNVHRYWWEDTADAALINQTAAAIYSRPNQPFITPRPGSQADEEESPILGRASRSLPSYSQNTSKIALIDPGIHGSPIHWLSVPHFSSASAGTCTFLNLPYGSNAQSSLRIDPPTPGPPPRSPSKITLQIISRVLDRTTGHRRYLLTFDVDVTADFHAVALAELGALIGRSASDIVVSSPTTHFSPRFSSSSSSSRTYSLGPQPLVSESQGHEESADEAEEVDWIALADTLQRTSEEADMLDAAAERLAKLTIAPSDLGTRGKGRGDGDEMITEVLRDFLARVERARQIWTRFWVLRPGKEVYDSGVPRRMGVPWVSGMLYGAMEGQRRGDGVGLVAELVSKVAKTARDAREFVDTVHGMTIRFVPVFGGIGVGAEAGAWVCFLQG